MVLCVCIVIAGAYFRITQEPLPEAAENYVAIIDYEIFHKPSCSYVKRIKPSNLVQYSTREEAVSSGRRGCKVCKLEV